MKMLIALMALLVLLSACSDYKDNDFDRFSFQNEQTEKAEQGEVAHLGCLPDSPPLDEQGRAPIACLYGSWWMLCEYGTGLWNPEELRTFTDEGQECKFKLLEALANGTGQEGTYVPEDPDTWGDLYRQIQGEPAKEWINEDYQ